MENIEDFTNTGMESIKTCLKSLDQATAQRCARIAGKLNNDAFDLIQEMKESQSIRIGDGYLPDNGEDFIAELERMRKDFNTNVDQMRKIVNAKIDTIVTEIESTDLIDIDAAQLKINGYAVKDVGGDKA